MNIYPYETYTFSFMVNGEELWDLDQPIDGDLIAGLLIGIVTILGIDHENIIIMLTSDEVVDEYTLYDIVNVCGNYIREFRIEHLDTIALKGISTDNYFWIIRVNNDDRYSVCSFETPKFIQGFISMCNAFGVDFRDYVYGLPLKYVPIPQQPVAESICLLRNNYHIEGYDIVEPEFRIIMKQPDND